MTSKKRLIYAVIALVAIVVVIALVLIAILPGQAPAPQSLARKMVIDSSDPGVHHWSEEINPPWNETDQNSHISYVSNCEHVQVRGSLVVWNSTSEAVAKFHSWNLTSNYYNLTTNHYNLTVGDESSIDVYEFAFNQYVEIYFIRGNVTAWLRCQVYFPANLEVGIEESLMLALAQDMKILQVQAAIDQ